MIPEGGRKLSFSGGWSQLGSSNFLIVFQRLDSFAAAPVQGFPCCEHPGTAEGRRIWLGLPNKASPFDRKMYGPLKALYFA